MISEKTHRNVERSGEIVEGAFTIKASAGIYSILRDHLYSDKHLAIVREVGCNARDSHVASGQPDRPIEVFVPSNLIPVLKFRDFGHGLSREQMFEVFCVYGESSKTESNDQIGYFGIGAKSPFCMSTAFQVTSFHNNVKSVYSAYLDETDCGKLAILSENECFSESGLEISIPVKNNDIYYYQKTIQEFFRYWKIKPVIKNIELVIPDEYFEGTYKKLSAYSCSCILMGGIAYTLDAGKLNGLDDEDIKIIKCGLVFNANIGDIGISASRETVAYVAKTFNFLKAAVAKIREEVLNEVEKLRLNVNSIYSAKSLHRFLCEDRFIETVLGINNTQNQIEYNGKFISSSLFNPPFYVLNTSKIRNSVKTREHNTNIDFVGSYGNWYYMDRTKLSRHKINQYNKALYRNVGQNHVVASIADIDHLQEYCNEVGLDFSKFQNITKAIVLPKPVRNIFRSTPSDYITFNAGSNGSDACCGSVSDIPANSIYFLRSGKSFKLPSSELDIDMRYFHAIITHLKLSNTTIYGLSKRDIKKFGSNLQNGEELLQKLFKDFDSQKLYKFGKNTVFSGLFSVAKHVNNVKLNEFLQNFTTNWTSDSQLNTYFAILGLISNNFILAVEKINKIEDEIIGMIPLFTLVEERHHQDARFLNYVSEKLENFS